MIFEEEQLLDSLVHHDLPERVFLKSVRHIQFKHFLFSHRPGLISREYTLAYKINFVQKPWSSTPCHTRCKRSYKCISNNYCWKRNNKYFQNTLFRLISEQAATTLTPARTVRITSGNKTSLNVAIGKRWCSAHFNVIIFNKIIYVQSIWKLARWNKPSKKRNKYLQMLIN